MGNSTNHIGPAPGKKGRPSLLEPGVTATEHNILDVVGKGKSRPAPTQRPPRAVWLVIPLIAAATWAAATYWPQPESSPPATLLASATSQPVHATSPATTEAARSSPETRQPEVYAPGPLAAADAPLVPPPAEVLTAPQAQVPGRAVSPPAPAVNPPNRSPVTSSPKPRVAASTTKAARQQPTKAQKQAKEQAKEKMATTLAEASDESATAASRPINSPRPNDADPDVELISALLKHQTPDAAARSAPSRAQPSIADLVASCQNRSSAQTLQCQRRICEGSWGKAQACPISKAPKSLKAAAP